MPHRIAVEAVHLKHRTDFQAIFEWGHKSAGSHAPAALWLLSRLQMLEVLYSCASNGSGPKDGMPGQHRRGGLASAVSFGGRGLGRVGGGQGASGSPPHGMALRKPLPGEPPPHAAKTLSGGKTPLMLACAGNHLNAMHYLLGVSWLPLWSGSWAKEDGATMWVPHHTHVIPARYLLMLVGFNPPILYPEDLAYWLASVQCFWLCMCVTVLLLVLGASSIME
jgi:hypothetical protein